MRKRIGWLLLLFITESLTGSVLRHFENELQAAVAREWEAYGKWMEVRAGLAYQLENDATEEQMVQSLQAGGVAFPVFWAALESRRQLEDTLLELDAGLLKLQGRILNHRFQ